VIESISGDMKEWEGEERIMQGWQTRKPAPPPSIRTSIFTKVRTRRRYHGIARCTVPGGVQ
jgi:hypothetical protein